MIKMIWLPKLITLWLRLLKSKRMMMKKQLKINYWPLWMPKTKQKAKIRKKNNPKISRNQQEHHKPLKSPLTTPMETLFLWQELLTPVSCSLCRFLCSRPWSLSTKVFCKTKKNISKCWEIKSSSSFQSLTLMVQLWSSNIGSRIT